jgi:hypothetical protein
MVSDGWEVWDEPLQSEPWSKTLHHPLPFSDGHVRILRPIVQRFVWAVFDIRHNRALGGGVGAEFIGYDSFRRASLLAQEPRQQPPRRLCVPVDLHDLIEDISLLIDSAPEIAFLAIDADDDFVEMPNIVAAGRLTLQATGVFGAKFDGPTSYCFVGYENAALKQHFLDQTQAQGKSEIEPDRMRDDLRRKSVALVADGAQDHGAVISSESPPPS